MPLKTEITRDYVTQHNIVQCNLIRQAKVVL